MKHFILRKAIFILLIFSMVVTFHIEFVHASSTNIYEDNFLRANTTAGWGTTTNNDGVSNFPWGSDAAKKPQMYISNNTGTISYLNTTGSDTAYTPGKTNNGGDSLIKISFSNIGNANAGSLFNGNSARVTWYDVRINTPAGQLQLEKKVSSVITVEAYAPISLQANTYYWLRSDFNPITGVFSAKIWADGTQEPAGWDVTWTDTTPLPAGTTGMHFHWVTQGVGETISIGCYAYAPSGTLAEACN